MRPMTAVEWNLNRMLEMFCPEKWGGEHPDFGKILDWCLEYFIEREGRRPTVAIVPDLVDGSFSLFKRTREGLIAFTPHDIRTIDDRIIGIDCEEEDE